jgi:general secretion pathway protein D
MVPKSFQAKSANTSVFIEHTDWASELIGVQLEVTPELREGGLIDLELKPRVMDLIGEDSYVATPSNLFMSSVASAGVNTNPVTGSLPYFRIREMETQVTVADGSTLAMGGLIYDRTETFKDKVPLLGSIPYIGRLFRSEGEKTIKRNLMVFVTATEVDTNGRRVSDLAMKK